jgi:hypothetical protein
MLQDKRLLTLILIGILAVVALIVAFNAGQARGRLRVREELLTVQAEMMAILSATPTETLVPLVPTNSPTPTFTSSPSPTPLPTDTPTPTLSPTPTTTPASPEAWAERYRQLAEAGLNSAALVGFSGAQAETLLRGLAQEQELLFVPAAYYELAAAPWAAFVAPRTPQGQVLPMIFWREPDDQNRVRGQLLHTVIAGEDGNEDLSALMGGLRYGTIRQDFLGRLFLLLVERTDLTPELNAYVLSQPEPDAEFELLWSSPTDPKWSIQAAGSEFETAETEAALLPDLIVTAPLGEDTNLRRQLSAPNIILEQPPFARQWAQTRWRYVAPENTVEFGGNVHAGYNLQDAALRATPLSTLAYLLQHLRNQNVGEASNYATRLDLLQQAFDMGLSEQGIWLAYYLDDNDNPVWGNGTTNRLRFFDNANRARSFTALFEEDAEGDYRVAGIEAAPAYEPNDLLTPAPPLPAEPAAPETPSDEAGDEAAGEAADAEAGTATPTPTLTTTPTFTPSATNPPTETPTPAPTFTPTPTFTASATVPPTYTATSTPPPAPTDTETPPPTDTPSPLSGLAIPTEQAPLARAIVFRSPANLRAGPAVEHVSLASLNYGVPVDLFGITEAGDWILLRINAPDHPQHGMVGWIATDLLQVTGDLAFLPRYFADGTPVIPPTPTYTPTPGTPTATLTATPIPTPVVQEPVSQPAAEIVAPQPGSEEQIVTIAGERVPADPFNPIDVTRADGQAGTLSVDTAEVQIWSGLFGDFPGRWIAAPAELLWPGSQVYVTGNAAAGDPERLVATSVRIAAAPVQERARLLTLPDLASALVDGNAVAMLGSREEQGVYMLETDATLRQLYTDEKETMWAGSNPAAGIVVSTQDAPTGPNRFSWVRGDGLGVQIFAQPFHSLRGVVGDVLGGLWWIETPQANLDLWQLWHYDPATGEVSLKLRASGEALQTGSSVVRPGLTPLLIAAYPLYDAESATVTDVTLVMDTLDRSAQTLYTGVFRLAVRLAENQPGEVNGTAQLLLTPESYRGPLQLSPDRSKLAYFVYEPDHLSLTSGFIRPANMLRVLTLEGRGTSTIRTVYATENRFEFLAPNLAWQGNDRLVLARSRFAPGDTFGIERFGVVQVQLPPPDQPTGTITIRSYLFPTQRELRDYTTCQDGRYTLTIATMEDGNLELARWDGGERPQAIFLLPPSMSRAFLCWQAPDSLVEAPQ